MSNTLNLNKIQRVSYWSRRFFQFLLLAIPCWSLIFWLNVQYFYTNHPQATTLFISKTLTILHPFTAFEIWWGLLISFLFSTGFTMLILYFLIGLFKLYEQGEIFTLQSVQYLKKIGYAILASQIAGLFYDAALSLALTFNNPAGQRVVTLGVNQNNAFAITTAIMIIFISWIMAEACKLREEQEYTV